MIGWLRCVVATRRSSDAATESGDRAEGVQKAQMAVNRRLGLLKQLYFY